MCFCAIPVSFQYAGHVPSWRRHRQPAGLCTGAIRLLAGRSIISFLHFCVCLIWHLNFVWQAYAPLQDVDDRFIPQAFMDQSSGLQGTQMAPRLASSCSDQMLCSESVPNYTLQSQNGFRSLCITNQGQNSALPTEYTMSSSCFRPKFPSNMSSVEDAYSSIPTNSWSSVAPQPASMPDQWTLNHGMQKFQPGQCVNFNQNGGANESFYGSIHSSLPVQHNQTTTPQG